MGVQVIRCYESKIKLYKARRACKLHYKVTPLNYGSSPVLEGN